MAQYGFLIVALMVLVGYFVGRAAGRTFVERSPSRIHSRPIYHGAFVAIWVGVPALVLLLIWLLVQDEVVELLLVTTLPPTLVEGASDAQIALILQEIRNVAGGRLFGTPSPEVVDAADTLLRWEAIARWAMLVVVLAVAMLALMVAHRQLSASFRARNRFEAVVTALMIACAVTAILTTVGIIGSLVYESLLFFRMVPVDEFLFGLNWEPQIPLRADQVAAEGAFGIVPVFLGTIVIATIAMLVATPIGILAAIYLVEFANDRVRSVVKPVLEILAGVPTVVYGFFAILTVAPAIREFGGMIGLAISPNSAIAAGSVLGIMIIPFISSLTDDALSAVPRSLRDGSLAMGATRGETMVHVLIPAAVPGIVGGILLALSRAIGETMIVVMAAGIIASLTINPLESVTTVTVQIVTLLIGDTAFDSPKTLAAFALGLTLFVVTLGLNVLAVRIVQRYREKYD